ncbi:hypothetical protein FHETE_5790 [Fusarium heterosporum]|uniref:Uncharacterized protein n=1 Tax=Fusarium heterosporum TaxID=42747 RepID=A0A8H5TEH6_FUSHE|nr:hypothetical protein FHETE_5790 [Fusarium heterosporum]
MSSVCIFYSLDFTLQSFTKLRPVFLTPGILSNISYDPEPEANDCHDAISRRLPSSVVSLRLAWDRPTVGDVEAGMMALFRIKEDDGTYLRHLTHICLDYTGKLVDVVHQTMDAMGIEFVMLHHHYGTLVLDLFGVLVNHTVKGTTGLSRAQITSALHCPDWHNYEKGQISRQECYERVCSEFGISLEDWTKALDQWRESLKPNMALISAIGELKRVYPQVKVLCLSNIPEPELALLKDEIDDWEIIDEFVASSKIQQRKPDLAVYNAFLDIARTSATSCILVDDEIENVVAAQTLGFKGIPFDNMDVLIATLHNLLGNPIARAKKFLENNAKNLSCTLSTGEMHPDNFSQLLILQNTGDRNLVLLENKSHSPTWNYFRGSPSFAGFTYPDDSETTALAMTTLDDIPMTEKLRARDEILIYLNPDGMPTCWLSKSRPRFCHCICATVFRFFVVNEWINRLPGVYEYLCSLLETRAYVHGSRYYKIPDWFLYTLSDLCARRASDPRLQTMRVLLIECVYERMGCNTNVLGAAMRALSAQSLGLQNKRDLELLLERQQLDGGWELAWLYQYGSTSLEIGSRGVVTAMAMNAIQRACL